MTTYEELHDRIWDILMWRGECNNADGVAHEVIAQVLGVCEAIARKKMLSDTISPDGWQTAQAIAEEIAAIKK